MSSQGGDEFKIGVVAECLTGQAAHLSGGAIDNHRGAHLVPLDVVADLGFCGEAFGGGFTVTGFSSGTRWTIFQAHMTAGIQPIRVTCIAKARKAPKGLSSAKIMAHGNNMATNESNLRFVLIIYSWFLILINIRESFLFTQGFMNEKTNYTSSYGGN